jgi:hypothetical protein
MFEHHRQPLLSRRRFILRQLRFISIAAVIIAVSLAIGTWGYMHYAGFAAIDAFLNASMILSGMGPIGDLARPEGKLFASFFAIYSGVALLTIVAAVLAPFVHRLMHSLHIEDGSRSHH